MQINASEREVVIKIVYYGPSMSGKTTNLLALYKALNPDSRGRFMTVNTKNDRTLFFDLLPLQIQSSSGFSFKIKLFTVPGQVIHNSTRRLVLAGADGVVFVADSQLSEATANSVSFKNLKQNLEVNGLDPSLALVIQFNKRDLPQIRSDEELDRIRSHSKEPIYRAVALNGDGVTETLFGVLTLTYAALNKQHGLERKFGLVYREFMEKLLAQFQLSPSFLQRIKV